MLTITHVAAVRLSTLLRASRTQDAVMRVIRKRDRFHLQLDQVRGGDVGFSFEGRLVLVIDDWVSRLLSSGKLDVPAGGARLKLTRR